MSIFSSELAEQGMSTPSSSILSKQQKLNQRPPSPLFASCDRPRCVRQAALQIKFIIVGASIAGLSCAIELRLAGHDVHVVEALPRSALGKVRASLVLFPLTAHSAF